MNKEKLLAGAVLLMFAAALAGAGAPENAPPAWQTSPEVMRGAEVIPEVKHDTSPPLREMAVLHSPPGERAHELHLLHPPRAVQFISDPVLQTSTLPATDQSHSRGEAGGLTFRPRPGARRISPARKDFPSSGGRESAGGIWYRPAYRCIWAVIRF